MKRKTTIILVLVTVLLLTTFTSCDPNPLANLPLLDQIQIVGEAFIGLGYLMVEQNIENLEPPMKISGTLPLSYNSEFEDNPEFGYPPKYITSGSIITGSLSGNDKGGTLSIDVRSKDIPGRNALIILKVVENDSTLTLNGKKIIDYDENKLPF